MNNIPDVLGMRLPAAASLLDAAGVSHNTEILRPARGEVQSPAQRVIRQKTNDDGSVTLSVCDVQECK